MVDALSDPISDHIGRQLLHWFVGYSSSWYSTLSGSEFIDNFKKLESGASILEQGLGVKFDEEDEARVRGVAAERRASSQRNHNNNNREGGANRERAWRFIRRDDPIVEYGQRNFENLMLVDIMENCEEGIPVEMFNVLAPFHQNSGAGAAATGAATAPGSQNGPAGGSARGGVENMQVTQPCSAPSSPTITSPGALSSTSFCLPTGANGSSTSSGGSSVITSSAATDTGDPNWQATKSTVRERNAAMFNNDLMADIRFIVGTDEQVQTIPAHKYVLATGSSVFYAMFYGGLAENKQEIKVPDVEPNAFLTLLKYLYCDEIHLEADNVLATLYVAKKYIVPHLARACVNYLETSLTAKNACLLLSQSRLFEEPELMQRCWEVIDAQVCDSTANLEVVDRDGTHFIPDSSTTSAPTATSSKTIAHTSRTLNLSGPSSLCSPQSPCFKQSKSLLVSPSASSNGTEGSSSLSSSTTISSSVSTSSLSTSETDNSGEPSV